MEETHNWTLVGGSAAAIKELSADAARWQHVRDHLLKSDPKMDGTSYFFFRNPLGRGRSADEVVDNLIAEKEQHVSTTDT